jgi:hypothetical protein
MHHSGMGLSIYKGPIPPRNVEMVFHQVLYTKGSLESDQGRERMVFGEYKKRNNKTTNYLPKKKES